MFIIVRVISLLSATCVFCTHFVLGIKPLVLCCKEEIAGNGVHFNTQQYLLQMSVSFDKTIVIRKNFFHETSLNMLGNPSRKWMWHIQGLACFDSIGSNCNVSHTSLTQNVCMVKSCLFIHVTVLLPESCTKHTVLHYTNSLYKHAVLRIYATRMIWQDI